MAALGGAPSHWVDTRLLDSRDAPDELRAAAHLLTNQMTTTGQRAAARTLTLDATAQDVHLVVLDVVPVRRTPTDFRALLDTTLAIVRQQAEAVDVSLRVTVADDVPAVLSIDSEKIAWVVVSLAGNALRYVRTGSRLRPGGSIAVRAVLDRLDLRHRHRRARRWPGHSAGDGDAAVPSERARAPHGARPGAGARHPRRPRRQRRDPQLDRRGRTRHDDPPAPADAVCRRPVSYQLV